MITGIDVSGWQPKIDWSQVAAAGHAFAFVKATEGVTGVSSRFAEQRREARRAGLMVGAYHFARPETDAVSQAEHFCHVVMGDPRPGDLPPVLDFELAERGAPADQLCGWAMAWLERVERLTSRWPVIYTGPSFWRARLLPAGRAALDLTSWTLWEAHHTDDPAPMPMRDAPDWHWAFWQHSHEGVVPGIAGRVDLNRFRGTLAELRILACLGGTS